MKSAFNRAMLFQILNATQYNPRDRRFYYRIATVIAVLIALGLMLLLLFMS